MTTKDDDFVATGPGDPFGYFTAIKGDRMTPLFLAGGAMVGHSVGLFGFSGPIGNIHQVNNYTWRAGLEGVSNNNPGVAGVSLSAPGVFGQMEDPAAVPDGFRAGVVGAAQTQPGVLGYSRSGDGVQGVSFTGGAVRGYSFFGSGVYGLSGGSGPSFPNLPTAGVFGTSQYLPGVTGTSDTLVGVLGYSNNVGVFGQTTNPTSFAGYFVGNVAITGTLTAASKNGVVMFPDGSRRVLHCMESPEHWFEDFGTAKLKGGRAVVKLDPDFAKVIKRNDYHVFLTPKGDCGGLYVRRQGGESFEVRELGGGKSNVAFSFRIVGRRKDIRAHRRFATLDTRSPLPTQPRPREPSAAAFPTFVAGLEKEARARTPKGAKRARRRPADAPVQFEVASHPHPTLSRKRDR